MFLEANRSSRVVGRKDWGEIVGSSARSARPPSAWPKKGVPMGESPPPSTMGPAHAQTFTEPISTSVQQTSRVAFAWDFARDQAPNPTSGARGSVGTLAMSECAPKVLQLLTAPAKFQAAPCLLGGSHWDGHPPRGCVFLHLFQKSWAFLGGPNSI